MGFDNDHLGTLMPFGAPSTPSFVDDLVNRIGLSGSGVGGKTSYQSCLTVNRTVCE